jgi:valyl-tRNA synthetase
MNGVWGGHATQAAPPMATATLNRWILGETARTRAAVDAALADYRFNDAADALYKFVWGKVCDWYVEFSKPLVMDGTDAEKAETRAVMAYVLDRSMMMLHPFMPFITEDIWAQTGTRAAMLVVTDWPDLTPAIADAAADREMGWVIALIDDIRSVRAQMHVPAGLHVPLAVTGFGAEARIAWARNAVLIQRLARVESLTEVDAFPKGTVTIPAEGATFGLPLAGVIDVGGEKSRLEKTLEKLLKELGGMQGRLNNAAFVASAPAEVVADTREQVAQKTAEAQVLRGALARLAELG